MIGDRYWSTGVMLTPRCERWGVSIDFFDDGWCEDGTSEGTLRARYLGDDPVAAACGLVADAEKLGIVFRGSPDGPPSVYIVGDGEAEDIDYPPGWRQVVEAVAAALGWEPAI